jgi:hypothetical protein
MRQTTILTLLAILALGLSACEGGTTSTGTLYEGGTNALLVRFESETPPDLIYDNSQTPFNILLNVRNDGEFDTTGVRWRISGISETNFPNLRTRGEYIDTIMGRTKIQDQVIEGPPTFIELEGNRADQQICYEDSLRGSGELTDLTLKVDLCYGYATLATSTVCIRDDYLDGGDGCDPSTSSKYSVSGAPLTITSFSQQAMGRDKLRLQYDIALKSNAQIWAPGPNQYCEGTRTQKIANQNKVYVQIDANRLGRVDCTGLREGPTGADGTYVLNSGNYPQELLTAAALNIDNFDNSESGYIALNPDNQATLICTLTLEGNTRTDSLATIDLAFTYFIQDSVSKPLTITHIAVDGPQTCGDVTRSPQRDGSDTCFEGCTNGLNSACPGGSLSCCNDLCLRDRPRYSGDVAGIPDDISVPPRETYAQCYDRCMRGLIQQGGDGGSSDTTYCQTYCLSRP